MSTVSLTSADSQVRGGDPMNEIDTLQALLPRFKNFGKRPAVIAFKKDGTEKWTYAKLAEQATRLATGLAGAGVQQGDHLALFAENSPEWLAACLGVIACGAVAVPLDVQLTDKALGHALGDSGARYVFTTEHLVKRLKGRAKRRHCEPILLGESARSVRGWQELCAEPAEAMVTVSPDDRALLFYTSGTTGPPKGVPLTHANLAFQLNTLLLADLVTSDDRILLPLPLHHVYPFTVGTLTPLGLGLPIVLPYSLTGPQLMRALSEGEVTTIIGVPRLYRSLFEGIQSRAEASGLASRFMFRGALALSTSLARIRLRIGRLLFWRLHREMGPQLRILASGGAAIDPDLAWKLEALGWFVGTGYGLTETSPLLTLDKPGHARIGSVGRPIEGVEIRIDPVAPGEEEKAKPAAPENQPREGEVVARGPSVFAGYHNLPDKTEEAFTADGWFRTGDLGRFDDDGFLFITGRVKTLIVLEGGEKVQPDDVEEAYQQSAAIGELGVLQRERKLVAVIRPDQSVLKQHRDSQKAVKEAVRAGLEERSRGLASYQRIADFVLTRSPLPRTRLGKIRREDLDELYDQIRQGGKETKQTGPISEEKMAAEDRVLLDDPAGRKTWEWLTEHFSEHPLSPDTSLQLDLAIDSLEWLNLTLEIRQRLGVELNEEAIARIETVRDLLREVAEQPQAEGASVSVDPLEEPDKVLGNERQRWLAPMSPVELAAAKCLHVLDRILVRSMFRLSVHGLERLPKRGPFVLTPNHVSYLDSFVLAAALAFQILADTYWGGWTGVAYGRVFRTLRRLCHVVPIDPDRAAASSLAFGAAVLRDRHSLVWYPEGGHSKTGKLMPLRPGIGMLLKRYPVPVVPVRIEGTHEALPPGHLVPRPGRIQITFGSPLDPHELQQTGKGHEPHERITSALHDKMARLHRR